MVSLVVYYSKDELTKRQWWIRTILHTIVLEAVLLPLAHHWKFRLNELDGIIYALFVLAGKILWHLIDFGISVKTVAQINEKIRKQKMEQSHS